MPKQGEIVCSNLLISQSHIQRMVMKTGRYLEESGGNEGGLIWQTDGH